MNSIDILPWNESFKTGLPQIDEQHKRLVALLNQLANHLVFNPDASKVNLIFDELAGLQSVAA